MYKLILRKLKSIVKVLLNRFGFQFVGSSFYYAKLHKKFQNFTMIPKEVFIENLRLIHKYKHVKGCVVECGVWRGGMSAAVSSIMPNKTFYLFDSFEGLPEVQEVDGVAAALWQKNKKGESYFDNCRAEINEAEAAMNIVGAEYKIVKGWFADTLPNYSFNESISVLRLDGDWYESTMDCLISLYPKVAEGGLIIIDDYCVWDGCTKAIHDYFSKNQITCRIKEFNNTVSYIVKAK